MKKTEGRKSRDTVPLSCIDVTLYVLQFGNTREKEAESQRYYHFQRKFGRQIVETLVFVIMTSL
jgi:hypothetical protein